MEIGRSDRLIIIFSLILESKHIYSADYDSIYKQENILSGTPYQGILKNNSSSCRLNINNIICYNQILTMIYNPGLNAYESNL